MFKFFFRFFIKLARFFEHEIALKVFISIRITTDHSSV